MSQSREEASQEGSEEEDDLTPKPKKARTESHGFVPIEQEEPEKEKKVETEEEKKLKQDINKIICRYPGVVIRTSHKLMEKLNDLEAEELKNVLLNASNDVTEIRGTPSAESILLLTLPVDKKIPGYTDYCQRDVELKRDIEEVMIEVFGFLGTKLNILFRLVNNAYKVYKKNTDPHEWQEIQNVEEKVGKLYARPIEVEEIQDTKEGDDRRDGAGGEQNMRKRKADSADSDWPLNNGENNSRRKHY